MGDLVVEPFAGPGGASEGMASIGVRSLGIEWDHAACRTAVAAGHARVRADVASSPLAHLAGRVWGMWASPPCPSFSTAGKMAGIAEMAALAAAARAVAGGADVPGGWSDPRSGLVLEPIRFVRDLRPRWMALEQVPTVLPLWRAYEQILRGWGYRTWSGTLLASRYGVPQDRTRAFLLGSLDRQPAAPPPTHHRDKRRPNPTLMDLPPAITMAEALGWEEVEEVEEVRGAGMAARSGARQPKPATEPAPVIRGGNRATGFRLRRHLDRRTISAAAGGTRAPTVTVPDDRPAPTVTAEGIGSSQWQWVLNPGLTPSQPGYRTTGDGPRQDAPGSVPVTAVEAAILQGFRPDYPFFGNKSQVGEQIGNAVPPPLAAAVVAALVL